MSKFTTHLMATTANGVETVDVVDHTDAEWLSFGDFMEELSYLGDDEVVFCAVDPDQLAQVESEYGVD